MSPTRRFLTLLAALLVLTSFRDGTAEFTDRADAQEENPARRFDKLERGLTPEQVRQIVGSPKQVARQIFYHRYREQWHYDSSVPVRLTFDCPRGQKPQLLSAPRVSDNK